MMSNGISTYIYIDIEPLQNMSLIAEIKKEQYKQQKANYRFKNSNINSSKTDYT